MLCKKTGLSFLFLFFFVSFPPSFYLSNYSVSNDRVRWHRGEIRPATRTRRSKKFEDTGERKRVLTGSIVWKTITTRTLFCSFRKRWNNIETIGEETHDKWLFFLLRQIWNSVDCRLVVTSPTVSFYSISNYSVSFTILKTFDGSCEKVSSRLEMISVTIISTYPLVSQNDQLT